VTLETQSARLEDILAVVGAELASDTLIAINRSAAFVVINRTDRMRRLEIDQTLANVLLSLGATWDNK
jgi:hypothetical protein